MAVNTGFIGLGVRAWQFLWTLIATALIGNVIASNNDGKMGAVNFALFALVLSWLSLIYGTVASWVPAINIPIVLTVLESITTLVVVISAIVLSAAIRVVDCHRLVPEKLPNHYAAWGSGNDEKRCREIQASTVFMWFLFMGYAATLAFSCVDFKRRGAMGSGGGPSMTQVRA